MVEEERLARTRDVELGFPGLAARACTSAKSDPSEAPRTIAYAWDATRYPCWMLSRSVQRWVRYNLPLLVRRSPVGNVRFKAWVNAVEMAFHDPALIRYRVDSYWNRYHFGTEPPPIRFVPHHLAHAASAFYCSGYDSAAVLTMDRNGEDVCTTIWLAQGLALHPVRDYHLPHSLGWFYSGFTDFLGFRPEYQEGHLMGLSAYGEPDLVLRRKVAAVAPLGPDGSYRVDSTYFYHGKSHGHSYTEKMIEVFGRPRLSRDDPIEPRHHNLALAVQAHLEHAVLGLARQAVRLTGLRRLCIAGGVGLNCVANGKILEHGIVDELFIQPASHDAGSALGAAQIVAASTGFDPRFRMRHAFYGPAYTSDEVVPALAQSGLPFARSDEVDLTLARLLADGLVVARFQGPLEIGPRALGARSILANPTDRGTADRVNRLKGREPWRPLGPAILEGAVDDYFEGARPTSFMTVVTRARPLAHQRLPAVIHVDGTTRPQIVEREVNPRFWHLLNAFETLTGVPAVINTSYNVGGEPIVCSPADAVRTFVTSELDVLAIEDYLVWKPRVADKARAGLACGGSEPRPTGEMR